MATDLANPVEIKNPKEKVDSTARAEKGDVMDPDAGYMDSRSEQQQWLEFVLMCLCNVAWTIDASILPIFFTEFQHLFHVSPTTLSTLSTAKGVTAALFAFPCGFLGELLPRPLLVGLGMLFWAAGLAVCGVAWSFDVLFVGRVLNGVGLGIVQPLLLSLVADKNAPTKRGSAFGSIYFVGAVANTLFGMVATSFADSEIAGVAGWRISIIFVAVFSALVGLLILNLVVEPNAHLLAERRETQGFVSVFITNMPKVVQLFKYPTFVLILCQGAPGTAPWTVFPFFTQWLELSCFTHAQTGLAVSAFGWGGAFSNLASGWLLNLVARRFPDHGPPTIANFSVASGIPFLMLFFFILPTPIDMGATTAELMSFFITFLFFGLGAAMCGTVNKKIFADIVPPSIFTYVFAIDQLVENAVGNFASLAVGVVTDKAFHYDTEAATRGDCAPEEAHKLGMGMFAVCNVAWAICFSVYLGLHYTYPRDRRRQLLLSRTKAQIKADSADTEEMSVDSSSASQCQ